MNENDNKLKKIIDLIQGAKAQHTEEFRKLDERLTKFEKSMTFINDQFENFKNITENLLKENVKLSKRNDELEREVKDVKRALEMTKKDLNDLEQYGRRDCVEVSGISREENEDTESLILKLGSILEIDVEAKDVQACHRLGKKQDAPIISKFVNRKTATAFLKAKKRVKKPINGESLGLKTHSQCKVYINESLTKQNKELLYLVRGRKKEKNWKYVWSRNGTIYARKSDESDFIRINNEKDIEKIV